MPSTVGGDDTGIACVKPVPPPDESTPVHSDGQSIEG
jgi:hypothetical protein